MFTERKVRKRFTKLADSDPKILSILDKLKTVICNERIIKLPVEHTSEFSIFIEKRLAEPVLWGDVAIKHFLRIHEMDAMYRSLEIYLKPLTY